jgi:hypothetical protein
MKWKPNVLKERQEVGERIDRYTILFFLNIDRHESTTKNTVDTKMFT